jgi:sugar phosphate isomerase/epimerase
MGGGVVVAWRGWLLAAALLAAPYAAHAGWPFFALCMDTHDAKKRNPPEQAQMLKELGYDGAGHLWLAGLAERLSTLDAVGLRLFQVYLNVDLAPDAKEPYDAKLRQALPLLKGRDAMLALLIRGGRPSDASLDARAVAVIGEIADMARESGVRVVLYPHVNNWLEKVDDCVRVAKKTNRANVGVMFNLCHWIKISDETQLHATLAAAMPYLAAVSINGTDTAAEIRAGKGNWIQPLDSGTFDMSVLLKALRDLGYRGPIGLQCYGIRGDARDHLARSMAAWRKLNAP